MRQQRMHAAVAAQSHQVQAMRFGVLHRREQHRILEEFARGDHPIDARDIHINDAAGADVQMAHFAVAHLAFGQADGAARRCGPACSGYSRSSMIVGGLARGGDRVAFRDGRKSPAVQDGQNERLLLAVHYWWNAFRPANFAASPSSSSMRRS